VIGTRPSIWLVSLRLLAWLWQWSDLQQAPASFPPAAQRIAKPALLFDTVASRAATWFSDSRFIAYSSLVARKILTSGSSGQWRRIRPDN